MECYCEVLDKDIQRYTQKYQYGPKFASENIYIGLAQALDNDVVCIEIQSKFCLGFVACYHDQVQKRSRKVKIASINMDPIMFLAFFPNSTNKTLAPEDLLLSIFVFEEFPSLLVIRQVLKSKNTLDERDKWASTEDREIKNKWPNYSFNTHWEIATLERSSL